MRPLFLLSGAVLAASLFFGGVGSRGAIVEFVPILLSCALLAFAYPLAKPRLREDRLLAAILACVVLLVALQFAPLPPSIWGLTPGRAELLDTYRQAGVEPPWAAIVMRPGEAARGVLPILPAIALLVATAALTGAERRKLIILVVAVALLNVTMGLLQLIGGPGSPLYPYSMSNFGSAVGLFANRNHFAAFLFCAIPLAAALCASRQDAAGLPLWAHGLAIVFFLILGLSISGSRSALILGVAAVAGAMLYVSRAELAGLRRGLGPRVAALGLAVIAAPLAMGAGLLAILERFNTESLIENERLPAALATFDLIKLFFPLGAGLGSFQQVYQLHENPRRIWEAVMNHAHNDWLEVALETGLPGIVLCVAGVVWLARAMRRLAGEEGADARFARAGAVLILLLMLHSLWDFPLRTIALSSLLGMCAGLTFRPGEHKDVRSGSTRRRGGEGGAREGRSRHA